MALHKLFCGAALAVVAIGFAAMPERAQAADITEVGTGRPDLAVFMFNGGIQGGETLALGTMVSKLPPNRSVAIVLNSPGGSVSEGMNLGRFFHRARIATFVLGYGGVCASACSMAFLGGRDQEGRPSRTKMAGGSLGFHQFRRGRTAAESAKKYSKSDMERELFATRAIAYAIIEYLADLGESMSFLHLMLRAPSANIHLLSNEEALTYGIHVMDERTEQVTNSTNIRARVGTR